MDLWAGAMKWRIWSPRIPEFGLAFFVQTVRLSNYRFYILPGNDSLLPSIVSLKQFLWYQKHSEHNFLWTALLCHLSPDTTIMVDRAPKARQSNLFLGFSDGLIIIMHPYIVARDFIRPPLGSKLSYLLRRVLAKRTLSLLF